MDPQPKKVKDVVFNFTGFGAFLNVQKNPTTELIESLQEWISKNELEHKVGDIRVLNVAAEDCKTYVQDIMKELEEKEKNDPETKQILVHMGVNGGAKTINLELQGYNKADFRGPDNRNYRPSNEKINRSFPLEHHFKTIYPAEELCNALKKREHKVELSTDPGRYVCNYIYYTSLCEGHRKSIPSIFVHVPQFAAVDKPAQEAFLKDFMKETQRLILQECNGDQC